MSDVSTLWRHAFPKRKRGGGASIGGGGVGGGGGEKEGGGGGGEGVDDKTEGEVDDDTHDKNDGEEVVDC